jgi:hypothetical protein
VLRHALELSRVFLERKFIQKRMNILDEDRKSYAKESLHRKLIDIRKGRLHIVIFWLKTRPSPGDQLQNLYSASSR